MHNRFTFAVASTISGLGLGMIGAFASPTNPPWILILIYVASALLCSALPIWLVARGMERFRLRWELRWPVTGISNRGSNTPLSDRIFNVRINVDFDRLHEFLVVFNFTFFNGTDYQIVRESITGAILCRTSSRALIRLPDPHLRDSQSRTLNDPFRQFEITLEQRIAKEVTDEILGDINAGEPVSFIFTSLQLWLDRMTAGNPFQVRIWDGVSCMKKTETIICERVPDASKLTTIE